MALHPSGTSNLRAFRYKQRLRGPPRRLRWLSFSTIGVLGFKRSTRRAERIMATFGRNAQTFNGISASVVKEVDNLSWIGEGQSILFWRGALEACISPCSEGLYSRGNFLDLCSSCKAYMCKDSCPITRQTFLHK